MRASRFPGERWLGAGRRATPGAALRSDASRGAPGSAWPQHRRGWLGALAWGHTAALSHRGKTIKAVPGLLGKKIHQQGHSMRDMGTLAGQPRNRPDTRSCRWFLLGQGPKGRAELRRDGGVEQGLVRCGLLNVIIFYLIKSNRSTAAQNTWPPVFCRHC